LSGDRYVYGVSHNGNIAAIRRGTKVRSSSKEQMERNRTGGAGEMAPDSCEEAFVGPSTNTSRMTLCHKIARDAWLFAAGLLAGTLFTLQRGAPQMISCGVFLVLAVVETTLRDYVEQSRQESKR